LTLSPGGDFRRIVFFWERALVKQEEEVSWQTSRRKRKKFPEALLKENEASKTPQIGNPHQCDRIWKNQSGPVRVLDVLSDCIQQSEGVWLRELTQKDNTITVNGTAVGSPDNIADFMTNLVRVGNFKNVNLINLLEDNHHYTFSITFEGDLMAGSAPATS
jgi:Tfp pilus assembly protein PilN